MQNVTMSSQFKWKLIKNFISFVFFSATYGSFQVELWRLRHTAARATVDALNSSERTISGDITHAPVKLAAEVCGVGPVFRLYLTIQNLSTYKMASNLIILLHADRRHYTIQKSMARVNIAYDQFPWF